MNNSCESQGRGILWQDENGDNAYVVQPWGREKQSLYFVKSKTPLILRHTPVFYVVLRKKKTPSTKLRQNAEMSLSVTCIFMLEMLNVKKSECEDQWNPMCLHKLSDLILTAYLWNVYYPNFTDEGTEWTSESLSNLPKVTQH